MARKRREITDDVIQEVKEIIDLQLENVNKILKKLSYNGVFQFNKKIADNEKFKRKNGEKFNLYPYDFWGGSYKGEDNYGKKQIDEYKSKRIEDLDNLVFDTGMQDIILAVNDLHNNPVKLTNVLTRVYKKDKERIQELEEKVKLYEIQFKEQQNRIKTLETVFTNLFYNSRSSRNSLPNFFDLKKSEDWFAAEQMINAFGSMDRIKEMFIKEDKEDNDVNVVDISKTSKNRRSRLEKAGIKKED